MGTWLARNVDRLDRVNVGTVLITNGLLCLFVLFAHGGALLLVLSGHPNEFGAAFDLVYVTVPVAFFGLLLALLGWMISGSRAAVLKFHTFMLGCLAAFAAWYAVDIIATGMPADARFSWNPILFGFVIGYPVYLARRTLLPAAALDVPLLYYAHVIAIAVSVVLSAAVFWRVYVAAT